MYAYVQIPFLSCVNRAFIAASREACVEASSTCSVMSPLFTHQKKTASANIRRITANCRLRE